MNNSYVGLNMGRLIMKNVLKSFVFVLLLSGLGFWGCSDSLVTEPQNEIVIEKTNETNLAKFSIPSELSVKKRINGEKGGIIPLAGIYKNKDEKVITVITTLTIPRGAFKGTKEISITTDKSDPVLSFLPDIKFNVPLKLNLTFIGFDLKALGLDETNTRFNYIGDDGKTENVINDGIDVETSRGSLTVKGAVLEHFSRFGFTR
jgi:hypothetical protein